MILSYNNISFLVVFFVLLLVDHFWFNCYNKFMVGNVFLWRIKATEQVPQSTRNELNLLVINFLFLFNVIIN